MVYPLVATPPQYVFFYYFYFQIHDTVRYSYEVFFLQHYERVIDLLASSVNYQRYTMRIIILVKYLCNLIDFKVISILSS